MIPLRDTNPSHRTPFVNITLIVLNVLAFFWELSLGPGLAEALNRVAFIPARFWSFETPIADMLTIFFAMFLHGGWLHLGSNMLYLWIFGDNIEDRLGHGKYLLFYLGCGVLATMAHAVMSPVSNIPSVGASGAIAGVLGAYLLLFPSARVMTFIPFGFFIAVRELPAIFVLGIWFLIQLFTGVSTVGDVNAQNVGGVAWFAHIGGFVAGLVLILLMGGRKQPTAYPKF